MTRNEAYDLGVNRGLLAAMHGQWHLTDEGERYESGVLGVHEAYDDLVQFAPALIDYMRRHTDWKPPRDAAARKAYEEGLEDGVSLGALRRLMLDEKGRQEWDIPAEETVAYAEIEAKARKRHERYGLKRVANLPPRAEAAIGAGLGSAFGGFVGTMLGGGLGMGAALATQSAAGAAAVPAGAMLGFFGGSAIGGGAGASLTSSKKIRRRAIKGGAIGGLLGPLGAAGGTYLATEDKGKRELNTQKRRLTRR